MSQNARLDELFQNLKKSFMGFFLSFRGPSSTLEYTCIVNNLQLLISTTYLQPWEGEEVRVSLNLEFYNVLYSHKAFIKGKTVESYIFHAWLAMQLVSSKPNEKESYELVLHQYRPYIGQAKKKRGNNLPEDTNRRNMCS